MSTSEPPDTAPLSGVRVLELGHIVAGPFCSLLLADLGADVVKVEHPRGGDALRDSDAFGGSVFDYVNRNKRSVTLDLKTDAGREALSDLVAESDVLVENFGPGATDRLGIGYDDLEAENPGLVYCSIKGFNPGPYAERPALDPVAEALAGLMSTTGYPDHPPARAGTNVADKTASLYGAMAIMAALRQRDATGEGQHVTAPIFEGTVTLMGGSLLYSQVGGEPKEPFGGGGQSQWAPYDVFRTGDGKWVFVGVTADHHWAAFADALGIDEPAYETAAGRTEHYEAVNALVAETLAAYDRESFLALFEDEIPVAPVNDTVEAARDEHLRETGMLESSTSTAAEPGHSIDVPASPLRSTGFENPAVSPAPELGEHTDEVLRSLGYDDERIADLHESGAV